MSAETAARFAGLWRVDRRITDFAGGPSGRFRGLARLTPEAGGLRYAEQGWLTLGAQKMQARRGYLWRFEGPTGVAVLFEDGAPFHRFDWSRAESEDAHLCAADRYAVRYSFARESWRAHWRVTGPRKDYAASTQYLRVTPETGAAQGASRALAGDAAPAYGARRTGHDRSGDEDG